jgi:hypothetical protein
MSLNVLECQVSKLVNIDTCPRPMTKVCSFDYNADPLCTESCADPKVRKAPCRPRSWADFSLS